MNERMIKKIMAVFLVLMAMLVMAYRYPLSVYARDDSTETKFDRFMRVLQRIDVKAKPNDDAETLFTFDEGDYISVTGETENGWYIVYYQGQTGYINKNVSLDIMEEEELDIEALDDELATQEVENKLIAEGVERYLAEARRSKIWGVIIVLLVIGIFVVGIISTIRSEIKN